MFHCQLTDSLCREVGTTVFWAGKKKKPATHIVCATKMPILSLRITLSTNKNSFPIIVNPTKKIAQNINNNNKKQTNKMVYWWKKQLIVRRDSWQQLHQNNTQKKKYFVQKEDTMLCLKQKRRRKAKKVSINPVGMNYLYLFLLAFYLAVIFSDATRNSEFCQTDFKFLFDCGIHFYDSCLPLLCRCLLFSFSFSPTLPPLPYLPSIIEFQKYYWCRCQ